MSTKEALATLGIIVGIFAFIIALAFLLSKATRYNPKDQPSKTTDSLYEWVSPDGVHYWRTMYGMAVRYDSNGQIVID